MAKRRKKILTPKRQKQRNVNPLIIIFVALLTILLGSLVFLLPPNNSRQVSYDMNMRTFLRPTVTLIPTTTPVPQPDLFAIAEYKTRFFDPNKKMTGAYYGNNTPKQIAYYPQKALDLLMSAREEDLQRVRCAYGIGYNPPNKSYSYYNEIEKKFASLTDERLLTIAKQANKGGGMGSLLACQTESNTIYIIYTLKNPNDMLDRVYYFARVNNNNNFEIIANEKIYGYSTCRPMELTGNNIWYVECSGGDGTGGSSRVFKIDINNKVISLVSFCGYETTGPTVECK